MNQLVVVELGKKTRRGLLGRVKSGFSGGGSYVRPWMTSMVKKPATPFDR